MVAGDNIALLIHTQAAVGVTIKGKTNVQALLHDKLLQALNMRRAGISVDVRAIRLIVDDVGISPQSIEHGLCNVPRTAVCAVQTNLDALKRVDAQRNQVAHIAITARHIVHGAADMLTMGKRQFRPVLINHMKFAVNIIFYQQQRLLRHLLTVAVNQFDTVVIVRVVAGGNHNSTVKVIHTGDVRHRWSSGNMEQISVCTRSG